MSFSISFINKKRINKRGCHNYCDNLYFYIKQQLLLYRFHELRQQLLFCNFLNIAYPINPPNILTKAQPAAAINTFIAGL